MLCIKKFRIGQIILDIDVNPWCTFNKIIEGSFMENIKAITTDEFKTINNWLLSQTGSLPKEIGDILGRLSKNYWDVLTVNKQKQSSTLLELRLAMGIIDKSEKGSSEKKS